MVITSFPALPFFDRIAPRRRKGLRSSFRDATEAVAFAMDFLEP